MPGTNTLAYSAAASGMKKKDFIGLILGEVDRLKARLRSAFPAISGVKVTKPFIFVTDDGTTQAGVLSYEQPFQPSLILAS